MATFRANQKRGSWVAEVKRGFEELGIPKDDPFVPVIIDDGLSKVDWKTRRYVSTATANNLGDWWNRDSEGEWRRLMLGKRPILLRKGMDWTTRTAGKKLGFYTIDNLILGTAEFSFEITGNLGSCE